MLKFGGNRIRRRTMVASHRLAAVLTRRSSSATSVAPPPPFWSSPFRWYSNKLDTHPILTKCATGGLVASSGNLVAQRIAYNQTNTTNNKEEEKEAFVVDWTQVGRFAFLNVAYVGT
jgi:hypothetical protein